MIGAPGEGDASTLLGRLWQSEIVQSYAKALLGDPIWTSIEGGTTHVEFREAGVELGLTDDGRVSFVCFFSKGRNGYKRYQGVLPGGLVIGDDRAAVHARLGPPSRSGTPQMLPVLGLTRSWDSYDLPAYSVHFEYAHEGDALSMVTLMAPEAAPGRRARQ